MLISNVKVGAINALHTFLVAGGTTSIVNETSPVGRHMSTVTGVTTTESAAGLHWASQLNGQGGTAGDGLGLLVHKTFSQDQITTYSDPTLEAGQMAYQNKQFVAQHSDGWLHSASTQQDAVLLHAETGAGGTVVVKGAAPAGAGAGAGGGATTDIEYKSSLHSHGQINLTFTATPSAAAAADANRRWSAFGSTPPPLPNDARYDSYRTTDFFGYARGIAAANRATQPTPPAPPAQPAGRAAVQASDQHHHRHRRVGSGGSGVDFPFNKSYSTSASIGPTGQDPWHVLNANYSADLFLGTNFDCNETTVNYKLAAHVESWINVFGSSKQVFFAEFVYGVDNGQPFADRATVHVWGKNIYSKALPSGTCTDQTEAVGHKEVGLDKSFTLWVSFVPLTLEVSVGLELDLGYTWDVCDTTLTANFAAVPKTTLTVAASASINLLVFDTTTSLNASFSQAVVPTVELRGDACLFNFKVERTASKKNNQLIVL